MTDRELLDEQVRYYRARALEYDATSPTDDGPVAEHIAMARQALRDFAPRGSVLELAGGTGLWSAVLAESADELLVTDASPEMIAVNRAKLGDRSNVRYALADAFDPPSDAPYDLVFFAAFLSHVPRDRFGDFWAGVRAVLAPGGSAFVFDEADHGLWQEDWIDEEAGIVRRTLSDGTVRSRCCGSLRRSRIAWPISPGRPRSRPRARSTGGRLGRSVRRPDGRPRQRSAKDQAAPSQLA